MEEVGKCYINEDIYVQETLSCMLCGNKGDLIYQNQRDSLFGAPGIWSLMHCSKCNLVWLNPLPVPEDIGKLYKTYYTHEKGNFVRKFVRLRRLIRNSILTVYMGYNLKEVSLFQKLLGYAFSFVGPIRESVEINIRTLTGESKGKLLDVGCGSGAFLAKMKELGWEVNGIDPDSEAVKVAREEFGLNIFQGVLEDAGFPENEFDAITMNHVIEHVYNPIQTFRECYRILKPGGKLVVITPNIDGLGARLFQEAWRGYEVPRHLHLFSPYSLRNCVEQAGLIVEELRTSSRSARSMWAASMLICRNGVLPGGSPKELSFWLRLGGLVFQLVEYGLTKFKDYGEEVILIARK